MRAIFVQSVIFPHNSPYAQAVAYTPYFELGKPVVFLGHVLQLAGTKVGPDQLGLLI